MKRTYIATTQEAKALHDGTQTAIIVKHSNKQPYAIGQEVVVREAWNFLHEYDTYPETDVMGIEDFVYPDGIRIDTYRSPITMPVSAARTRFRIVSCEAVRVRDVHEDDALNILECKPVNTLGDDYYNYYRDYMGSKNELDWPWFGETKDGIFKSWQSYITHKLGQSAWDNNDYVFYYKIEKI